jgi:hypothetical protein
MDCFRQWLGLMPFDEYEMGQRAKNMATGVLSEDIDRRTGRTWRGLVSSIAWCALKEVPRLYIKAANQRLAKDIRRDAYDMVMKLMKECNLRYPGLVEVVDTGTRTSDGVVFTDHYMG